MQGKLALLSLLMAATTVGMAQQARLHRVLPAEERVVETQLDHKKLPPDATGFEVERQQVFSLIGPSAAPLLLVPIRFETPRAPDVPNTIFRCGIYLRSGQADDSFLWTIGTGETEVEECEGIQAVGIMSETSDRPRLILMYKTSTPNEHWLSPLVLSYDRGSAKYTIDVDTSVWLGDQTDGESVAGVRRLLKKRDASLMQDAKP